MSFRLRAGLKRLIALPRRSPERVRADVDEELRFFLDARMQQLMALGMTRSQAEAEAARRLGAPLPSMRHGLHHSAHHLERSMRRQQWLDDLWHDLRYAARTLSHSRGFAVAVILTLGLGIGANAAMFGLVDRLLLRPPAFLRDPGNVHRAYFGRTNSGEASWNSITSYRQYTELAAATTSFDRMGGFSFLNLPVGEGEASARARVGGMSASLFSFFDAPPVLGRYFTAAEDTVPEVSAVAVLGYGYWQTQFGGATDVIGRRLRVGSKSLEIIGVAPRGFTGVDLAPPAVIVPLTTLGTIFSGGDGTGYRTGYGWWWMEVLAHRRPGVSLAAATTDLNTAFRRIYASQREANPDLTAADVDRLQAQLGAVQLERGPNQGNDSRVATWLIGVTAVVLLIACANVANLLLARALGRRREVAVRLALGVSRGRLLSQLLTESVLLATLGGIVGLVLAHWGGLLLRTLFLPDIELDAGLVDGRTLAFTSLATLAAGMLAGMVPALQSGRADVGESLKSGVREGTHQRSRARTALMVAQAALSVVLLVGAGLFVRSLRNVRHLDMGFDAEQLLYVSIDLRGTELSRERLAALKEAMRERAAGLPGVEDAARVLSVPFQVTMRPSLFVPGIDSVGKLGSFLLQGGSPEYFAVAGTRIVRGRGIEPADVAGAPHVMVVSEPMARTLWPGQDPIGKCVRLSADTAPCREVVGVAETIRQSFQENPELQFYVPTAQWQPHQGGLYVRVRGAAGRLAQPVRRELQSMMPGDAFVRVQELEQIIDPQIRSWRLGATLFVAFGLLALMLATIGLYSVMAYHVAQRGHELGVRMALGAAGRDVVRLVVRQGVRLAVGGAVLGLLIAVAAAPFIEPLLFNESPRDPLVMLVVAAAMLATAVLACLLPARRAARVDPLTALRSD